MKHNWNPMPPCTRSQEQQLVQQVGSWKFFYEKKVFSSRSVKAILSNGGSNALDGNENAWSVDDPMTDIMDQAKAGLNQKYLTSRLHLLGKHQCVECSSAFRTDVHNNVEKSCQETLALDDLVISIADQKMVGTVETRDVYYYEAFI